MKDYLLDVMQQHEHGLYMCELPTGNGKTYDSAWAMKEYADSIGDTKIIYLTTLNKNLPEDALRAAYGSEELYKRNVLRLRSNFDEVVEKILEIEVPEEMKTDVYLKLCKDVSLYRNAIEKRYADKEYIKELADRITEGDRQLRYEITKRLKNRFQTKTQRKNAIRTDAKYKWIGKLYPAVFTDDYKIILISVSKFMKKNSILIDSSYEFLNSELIENAVIVIDEFDATKDTIQSELIEKSLAVQEDYIQLFRQIYRTLTPNDFSSSMRQAMDEVEKSGNRNTFTTLMDEARKIAENYHVRLSIKTKEDLMNQRQIFLFNDGSFHTVLKEGAHYIRSTLNEEDNRIDVFFERKDEFFKLYVGELKKRILPPEMKAIVDMRESIGKDYLPEENFMLNKAEKISSVGLWTIRRMLAKDWTAESMQMWERLRLLVLQYPTASAYDWKNNEYLQKLYITSGEKRNQYIYSQYSDFNDVTIDFGNDKVAFKNSKRAKIKGNSDEVAIYEMSEKESGLQAILRYPGMKAYFEEMGYALKFEMNEYLLSPVLFHNIYKGALGEVAGKFILNRELGIELLPITEPEFFEFFDYKLSSDVYVDFKNWKFTYVQDRDEIRKDILRKLEAIGAKRVYIINVVSDKNYKPNAIVDQRLVEIPMLIRKDGTVCYENLHMIRKEDFENVN